MNTYETQAGALKLALDSAQGLLNAILSDLERDMLPDPDVCARLEGCFSEIRARDTALTETLRALGLEGDSPRSLDEYERLYQHLNQTQVADRLAEIEATLSRFCRVVSEDEGYDAALEPYRAQWRERADGLAAVTTAQAVDALAGEMAGARLFIEILSEAVAGNARDAALDAVSEFFVGKVYRGLSLGLYHEGAGAPLPVEPEPEPIPVEARAPIEPALEEPVPAKASEPAAEPERITIVRRKSIEANVENFKKDILKSSPYTVDVLRVISWLLYAPMETIHRVFEDYVYFFSHDIEPELRTPEKLGEIIERMVARGYVMRFTFPGMGRDGFCLSEAGYICLHRKQALRGFVQRLSSFGSPEVRPEGRMDAATVDTVVKIMARNEALLHYFTHLRSTYTREQAEALSSSMVTRPFAFYGAMSGEAEKGLLLAESMLWAGHVPEGLAETEGRLRCHLVGQWDMTDVEAVAQLEVMLPHIGITVSHPAVEDDVPESGRELGAPPPAADEPDADEAEAEDSAEPTVELELEAEPGPQPEPKPAIEPEAPTEAKVDVPKAAHELGIAQQAGLLAGATSAEALDIRQMHGLVTAMFTQVAEDGGDDYTACMAEASVLAEALKLCGPELAQLGGQIHYAVNLPLGTRPYKGDSMVEAFENAIDHNPLLLAGLLHAMFAPGTAYDYDLYGYATAIITQNDGYISRFSPALKQVFRLLGELNRTRKGFSPAVLSVFAHKDMHLEHRQRMANDARQLLSLPTIKAHIRGMPEFLTLCFGPGSDLGAMLAVIAAEKTEERELVAAGLSLFENEATIGEYINAQWKRATIGLRTNGMPLEHMARRKTVEHIERRVRLMGEWLGLAESSGQSQGHEMSTIRDRLLETLPVALRELDENREAGFAPIFMALRRMQEALTQGQPTACHEAYQGFLCTHWFDLDESYMPIVDVRFMTIPGMEPWRSALLHIAQPKQSFAQALACIRDPEMRYDYDNLGTALLIEKLLAQKEERAPALSDWEENGNNIRRTAESEELQFLGELELAFAYGRIEEHVREDLLRREEHLRQYFWDCQNFGRFYRLLDCLMEILKGEKRRIETRLHARLEALIEAGSKGRRDCPLIEVIRERLAQEDFDNAEEYLNRLASGETELPPMEMQGQQEEDAFGDFIGQFQSLFNLCIVHKGNAVRNWAPGQIKINPSWSTRQIESAKRLALSWPAKKGGAERSLIPLFQELGFDVENVTLNKNASALREVYALKVKRPRRNLHDYSHPIASFGTEMKSPINVVCLYGSYSATDINNIMATELHFGEPAIVLLDSPLDLISRRKLAEAFISKTSGQNNYLLLDRVLLLYLASLDQSERLSALLKCTLPLTFYQPFTLGGGVTALPDEMFFGRKQELNTILDPKGAVLVYGGRQLGKTALLKRARSIAHQPEKKEYAIFVNANKKGIDGTLAATCEELSKDGLVPPEVNTWKALCEHLSAAIEGQRIMQLRLLVDEADTFLEDARRDRYTILEPLFNLMRDSGSQFKFVLAGLHNVARSREAVEHNGILLQLSAPLCIKPLSSGDASNMLQRPLLYLGFKKEHLEKLRNMLANANYYPGTLHFFGYNLIQTISKGYGRFYSPENGNPPYELTDKQLKDILISEDLNSGIRDRFTATLKLDERYEMLAKIIAYRYYLDENNQAESQDGYSVREIKEVADTFGVRPICGHEARDIETLLSEMAEMGVLWTNPEASRFRLRRNSFLANIGNTEAIEEFLLSAAEGVTV